MKVGILTFHFSDNLGAVLQAYALQKVILQLGHDCEIINYRPARMRDDVRHLITFNTASPKIFIHTIISSILHFPFSIIYRYRWDKFKEQNFIMSGKKFNSITEINDNHYECIIVGSDQVWNQRITGKQSGYFLDWVNSDIKKISYAASFGEQSVLKDIGNEEISNISFLDGISVRESYAKNFLGLYIDKEIAIHPDPTLLLKRNDLMIKKKSPIAKPYLFLYIVSVNPLVKQIANKIAKDEGLLIVDIGDYIYPFDRSRKHIDDAGPWEFINLIYHAKKVVTSSFHGTIFSLLLHKEFFAVPGETKPGRISQICKDLNIEERVVYRMDDLEKHIPTIDYQNIDALIDGKRECAIEWLKNII